VGGPTGGLGGPELVLVLEEPEPMLLQAETKIRKGTMIKIEERFFLTDDLPL
jgi:hypothetical protein